MRFCMIIDNFNVNFKRCEVVPLATCEAGMTTHLTRAINMLQAPAPIRTLLPATRTPTPTPIRTIGEGEWGSWSRSWWRLTRSCCSRSGRVRKSMTWRKRLNCCWPKTRILSTRTRTWSSWFSKRTAKSKCGSASSTANTRTPTWPRPRRRRCSITSISRTRSTKFRSKNYSQRYL